MLHEEAPRLGIEHVKLPGTSTTSDISAMHINMGNTEVLSSDPRIMSLESITALGIQSILYTGTLHSRSELQYTLGLSKAWGSHSRGFPAMPTCAKHQSFPLKQVFTSSRQEGLL